jgi:hypothetical protein
MMRSLQRTAGFTSGYILPLWALLLPTIVLAAEPAKKPPPPAALSCEVILGQHIKDLGLIDPQGRPVPYSPRGSSMFVQPGQYVIETIDLQGGYSASPSSGYFGRSPDRLTLIPGKPCRFDIRFPLTPSVTVTRVGRLLKLDYQLLDGDGRKYRRSDPTNDDRAHPPQFAIYQGDGQIGSGTFEYG